MLDQEAEIAENRKLDKLLDLLTNEHSDVESEYDFSEGDKDYDDSMLSQNEDDLNIDIVSIESKLKKANEEVNIASITSLSKIMPYLSFEEFDIITECADNDLRDLMVLNRAKHVYMKELIKKYKEILNDCRHALKYYNQKETRTKQFFKINKMGFPYFRVEKFGPMCNKDFYRKKANFCMDLTYSTYRMKWTIAMLKKLKTCVLFEYYKNLMADEKALKLVLHKTGGIKAYEELVKLRMHFVCSKELLVQLIKKMGFPELWNDKFICWTHIAEETFKDVTLDKCLRAMWNFYIHPKINHGKFCKEENEKILQFVNENVSPDWKKLSIELNTDRSEHQLCRHYTNELNIENIDSDLEQAIDNNDSRSSNINLSGSVRAAIRKSRRMNYLKETQFCRLGHFTLEEDLKILALVKQFGLDFNRISSFIPHRTKQQIKQRYNANLCKDQMKFGSWQVEEDRAILDHVKTKGEQNWNEIAKNMNRNAAQVRHRFNRLKKLWEKNPDLDIETLPRSTKQTFANCKQRNRRIRAFYKTEQTEHDMQHVLNMGKRMPSEIDDELVKFFAPAANLKKTRKRTAIDEEQLQSCVKSIKLLLGLFQANLHIPKMLKHETELDFVDFEILELFRSQAGSNDNIEFRLNEDFYLPPNVSSTQSLRYLFMLSFNCNQGVSCDNMKLLKQRDDVQLFIKRFKTFFMWPALMSIIDPPEEMYDHDVAPVIKQEVASPVPKRKVGRPKKNHSKIMRMREALSEKRKLKAEKSKETNTTVDNLQEPVKFIFENGELKLEKPRNLQSPTISSEPVDKTIEPETVLKTNDKIPSSKTNDKIPTPKTKDKISSSKTKDKIPTPKTKVTTKSKVLVKVLNKSIIDKLKQQNLIKTVTPVKLPSQMKDSPIPKVLTPSILSKIVNFKDNEVFRLGQCTVTCIPKRKVCDELMQPNEKKQKLNS